MALTTQEKKAILVKLAKGKTGSELAREYGVSPSYISKLKKDATLNAAAQADIAKKSVVSKKEEVKSLKVMAETPQAPTPDDDSFICVVSSNKTVAKKVRLKVGATFGDLIKAVDENGALEGVFKDVKSSEKTRVKQNKDVIPAKAGQEYHVYLMPLKANSGLAN
jgi:hypothetical protein